ncbi:MAG TPA: site-specific DNA-methyltransferase [Armatimonadota bacterium]|nr:site-specific DNA-methyltransferase [Armatimonadota bacterium]
MKELNGTGATTPANEMDRSPRAPSLRVALQTMFGVLFEGDCLRLFSHVRSDSVDCIFADPPFNLAKDYGDGSSKDDLEKHEYLDWCFKWIDESVRVLKPGGAMFIYILPRWGYHFASRLEEQGMEFRHWIALSMKGSYPRGNKLYPAHYALLYFTKGRPRVYNKIRVPIPSCRHCGRDIKDYGGHRKYLNPLGLNLTDFWEDTAPARHLKFKARWHINELKPMIPSRCIQMSTNPLDIVLDPFGGGGSTYEAAQGLGRHWLGSELVTAAAIVSRMTERFPWDLITTAAPSQLTGVGSVAEIESEPEAVWSIFRK